jgi:hypothetical protein
MSDLEGRQRGWGDDARGTGSPGCEGASGQGRGSTHVWAPVGARGGPARLGHGAVVVLELRHGATSVDLGLVPLLNFTHRRRDRDHLGRGACPCGVSGGTASTRNVTMRYALGGAPRVGRSDTSDARTVRRWCLGTLSAFRPPAETPACADITRCGRLHAPGKPLGPDPPRRIPPSRRRSWVSRTSSIGSSPDLTARAPWCVLDPRASIPSVLASPSPRSRSSSVGPQTRPALALTLPSPAPVPQNLLRAAGLFVGAIVFMRNFGDQMAI